MSEVLDEGAPVPTGVTTPEENPLLPMYYNLYDGETIRQRGVIQKSVFDALKAEGQDIRATDAFGNEL